jgi:hypothetical protein
MITHLSRYIRLMVRLTLLSLLLTPLATSAQVTPDQHRTALLKDVPNIARIGSPGPVAISGEKAFPLLAAASSDNTEAAVAAATEFGKGRIVLFGQNGYLKGDAADRTDTLLVNTIRWASQSEKPKVGVIGQGIPKVLTEQKISAQPLKNASADQIKGFSVLLVNMQGVDDADSAKAIIEFVKQGGGLVAGMTGWAYSMTSGGKELVTSHQLNLALVQTGLAITDGSSFDKADHFQPRTTLSPLLNARTAIAALQKGSALSKAEFQQAAESIQLAVSAQPPGDNKLQQAALSALQAKDKAAPIPSAEQPLTEQNHAQERLVLGMEARMLKLAEDGNRKAHPAHTTFPGAVPAGAPRIAIEVRVDSAVPGWTSSGAYAAAGEVITVTVLPHFVNQGYAIRIGCHSDMLYHLERWERVPEVTRSIPITQAVSSVSSAFGGLVYIEVPSSRAENKGIASVKLATVVAAPYFVLGRDDDAAWEKIKTSPAPWAELAGKKIILSCPSEVARTIRNPTQLMQFWDSVVEAQDEITNQASERKRPERIVPDVQISAGYMHSGYPIMIPTSAAMEMVTYNRIKFPGWGFYHEIGHNHQRKEFTFEGTGEVTNNVIGMYCYEHILKRDKYSGHTAITAEARQERMQKFAQAEDKFAAWKKDPFLALITYSQLVDGFGWDAWRKYLHSFADPSFGPKPKNDAEARDQFLIRYSKVTAHNLSSFFDQWHIPVSQSAKDSVKALPTWLPSTAP